MCLVSQQPVVSPWSLDRGLPGKTVLMLSWCSRLDHDPFLLNHKMSLRIARSSSVA